MRRFGGALILAGLALAGCAEGPQVTSAARAPRQIAVTGDAVVIAAPTGYCIDATATREREDSAIVILARCGEQSGHGGVLTATVSPENGSRVAGSVDSLAAHFASPRGRAALSRDGNPQSVELLGTVATRDTLYLHLQDRSRPNPGLERDYWRAMFDLGDRIATISVRAFRGEPLAEGDALTTAKAFARKIRAAN